MAGCGKFFTHASFRKELDCVDFREMRDWDRVVVDEAKVVDAVLERFR